METSKNSSMACTCHSLPFFDFPAEIRNLIYGYAQLTGKEIKPIFSIDKQHVGLNVACFSFPAKVFTVSKAFDREAAAVFYSKNYFCFESVHDCFRFMQQIGSVKCSSLQYLKMKNFDFFFAERDLIVSAASMTFPQYLGKRCPMLKRVEFSDVTPAGKNGEWRLPKLQQIERLVDAMPHLRKGAFIKGPNVLRLSMEDDDALLTMQIHTFNTWNMPTGIVFGAPFDVKQEIEDLKSRAAARKVEGTRKAMATREAAKAAIRAEMARAAARQASTGTSS